MTSDTPWYYASDGQPHGPFSTDEMMTFVRNGGIREATLVWREGFETWRPAGETELLSIAPSAGTRPDAALPGATPGMAFQRYWQKYVVFSGRASLSEFWWMQLILIAASVVLQAGDFFIIGMPDGTGPFSGLFWLVTFLPSLALAVRRLHDTNRSGWWLLLILIPLIGMIVLIVFCVQRGTRGPNRFGL